MSNGTIVVPQQSKTIITVPVTTYQSIVQPQTGPIVYISLATRDTVGVVKIGEGINISQDGTISFDKSEVTIKSISLNGQQLTPDSNKNVAINLTKSSVGLDQVDNTSDANKPLSLSMIAALQDKQNQINSKLDKQQGSANAGKILRIKSDGTIGLFNYESYDNLVPRVLAIESFIPQGTTTTNTLVNKSEIADVPHLVNGKLPDSVIPKSAITNTYVVNTHAEMLALTDVEEGDVCIVNEESKTYILQTEPSGWIEMKTPGGEVSSVNGKTGTVVLTLSDISTDVVTISENQEITSLKNFTQRPTVNGTQIALVTDAPGLSEYVKNIENDFTQNAEGFRFKRNNDIDMVLSFSNDDFEVTDIGPYDYQDQRLFNLKSDVVRTNKLNNFTILPTVNNVPLATTAITDALNERIDGIQYDTFPNAVRVGDLTINDGQASGFTTADYLMFPFILDVQNRPFQVDFCFTTGSNVTTQQNVLDSKFGIALAIKNGKGLMAVSNNGINWASQGVGTINIQPNTTYYARLSWNRLVYKTQISTDGVNYVDDISITNATQPYPVTMFIGGGSVEALGHTATPFFGSIDMNKAYLYVDSRLVWHGMIAASLETLADVSLSNIDEAGKQVIKDNGGTDVKVDNVKQTEINFISDPQTQLDNKVPTTRTVNGKSLANNITLTAGDVGSYTKAEILNVIYPVGSIYLSVNDVSPQTFIGGTWTKVIDNLPLLYDKIYSNAGENMSFRGNSTGAIINLRSGEAKSQGSAGNLAMWVQSGETNGWETFGYASGLHTRELKVYAWKRTS